MNLYSKEVNPIGQSIIFVFYFVFESIIFKYNQKKVPLYGQCDVNGPRVCAVGKCFKHNDWYSQCLIDYCPKGWACEGIRRNLIVSEPKNYFKLTKFFKFKF